MDKQVTLEILEPKGVLDQPRREELFLPCHAEPDALTAAGRILRRTVC